MRVYHRVPAENRFWAKVDRRGPGECWTWKAKVSVWGYGRFWFDGKTVQAHRFAVATTGMAVPAHFDVLHSCDNKLCVNPNHLRIGTHQENMDDGVARGSFPFGERNHNAKMTETVALEIIRLGRAGVSMIEIADRVGVCRSSAYQVLTGQQWRRVTEKAREGWSYKRVVKKWRNRYGSGVPSDGQVVP